MLKHPSSTAGSPTTATPVAPRPPNAATEGSRHPWTAAQWMTASGAVVAEATAGIDPVTVFRHAAGLPHAIFLDSAVVDRAADRAASPTGTPPLRLGRYSFVAADPIHSWQVPRGPDWSACCREIAATFAAVRSLLADLACQTIPGLPPFQGGVAGLLAYECGLARLGLEPPPACGPDPLLSLHVYDLVFAYDHDLEQGWFVSQGLPARGPVERARRGTERLAAFLTPRAGDRPGCDTTPTLAPLPGHPLPGQPHVRSTRTSTPEASRWRACLPSDFCRWPTAWFARIPSRARGG